MTQRLKSAAIALALLAQPLCIRADGEGWTFMDYVQWGAGIGATVGVVAWALQPESDASLMAKADTLIENADFDPRHYSNSETDRQEFAQRNIHTSFDETQRELEKKRTDMRVLYNQLRDRPDKEKHRDKYRNIKTCLHDLDAAIATMDEKTDYMKKHASYFSLYSSNKRALDLIRRGCPSDDTSCAADFRRAMDDVEKNQSHLRVRESSTLLYNDVERNTYPMLAKEYGAINKRIEDARKTKEMVGAVAAVVSFGVQVAQQASAQLQQADEQPQRQYVYIQPQQPKQASQSSAQRQEQKDTARATQNSVDTYNKAQEDQAKKASLADYHKNCSASGCSRGSLPQNCLSCRLGVSPHAQCSGALCHLQKDAECPVIQAHKYCESAWCYHFRDNKCPRFHSRS